MAVAPTVAPTARLATWTANVSWAREGVRGARLATPSWKSMRSQTCGSELVRFTSSATAPSWVAEVAVPQQLAGMAAVSSARAMLARAHGPEGLAGSHRPVMVSALRHPVMLVGPRRSAVVRRRWRRLGVLTPLSLLQPAEETAVWRPAAVLRPMEKAETELVVVVL